MTVLVRPKRVESNRRRETPAHRGAGRPQPPAPAADHRTRDQRAWSAQRLATDQAVYTCQCGYVFEAPVSTSVGCPHCGGTQAW
jgi:hypothetical protein